MKTIVHPANQRGHANHGWLDSWHSFSFAQYYNPNKMHFGALRVLNDDRVAGGAGFGTHPHDNMEIVSIPLSGDLEHKDSTGRSAVIREGDVQIMSAGTGITHSEKNKNSDQEVQFLQIWVFPKERNISPRYDQRSFPMEERRNKLQTVVDPDGSKGIQINQDAWFHLGYYDRDDIVSYSLNKEDNGAYIFVLEGTVDIEEQKLNRRDAMGIYQTDAFDLKVSAGSQFLIIEVPMVI